MTKHTNPIRVVVISAGLSVPSTTALLADELTSATYATARERGSELGGIEVTRVDLRDHAHAITDALLTHFATGELSEAIDALAAADAVIVVTPTYQASYSGLLKMFVDILDADTLRGTPVLIAATGGTERHSLVLDFALRPLFAHLGAVVVPTGVFAATGDFGDDHGAHVRSRSRRAAAEIIDAAHPATAGSRAAAVDQFENVTPFAQLLANVS